MTWVDWARALHVAAVMFWTAALLYLPRLFVYHAEARPGSEAAATLAVMEARLLRAIANPAGAVSIALGALLLWAAPPSGLWFVLKLPLVAAMLAFHLACARWRRELADGSSRRSSRFFRLANEAPAVLALAIVVLAVARPV